MPVPLVPLRRPAQFAGVVLLEEVMHNFAMSATTDEHDVNNGTVFIYVVRSSRSSAHSFAVAWQFNAAHLQRIADQMAAAQQQPVQLAEGHSHNNE